MITKTCVFLFLLGTAQGTTAGSLGSAGHSHKTSGQLVHSILHMTTPQANNLLGKLQKLNFGKNDIGSMVMQGAMQWMHDLSELDPRSQEMVFAKLERYEDADGLSMAQRDLAKFGKALAEYTKETKGTNDYPPKMLEGYMHQTMLSMGANANLVTQVEELVQQIEEAIEESQPPDQSFIQVETWDQGGGTLIPKKFASAISSLSQKLHAQKNLSEDRKNMLDGMAKKFTVGLLLASAYGKDVAEKVTAL